MPTSIFDPVKKKLTDFKKRLADTVATLEEYDTSSIHSIPELTNSLKNLRNDVKTNLAHIENNINTTEATLSASASAGSSSGVAKSVKGIAQFVIEIKAAAECFKLIGEIVVLMAKIPILLAKVTVQMADALAKLALESVNKFLAELKNNIIAKINRAKAKVVSDMKNKVYSTLIKDTKASIKTNEDNIKKRMELLASQGKTTIEIATDPTIKAWEAQIKVDKAKLDELSERGIQ